MQTGHELNINGPEAWQEISKYALKGVKSRKLTNDPLAE